MNLANYQNKGRETEPQNGKSLVMDIEKLKKARELDDEISECKKKLERLKCHANPESSLIIQVNQYYGDFGKSFTNREEFKGEIASLLFTVILKHLEVHVALLEKQLEAL